MRRMAAVQPSNCSPSTVPSGAGRVLVTTFAANLAATMTINFGLLVDDAPTRSRVDITNVDKLANQIVTKEHGRVVILSREEQTELWEEIARRLNVDLSAAFLADEWNHVMLAQQLTTLDEYQLAMRPGRGKRIGPRQKDRIWTAVCAFEEELARSNRWTHETVVREAARLLQQRVDKPYRHVIVDEAQDLSPNQWRMLRAAVGHGGDDMFLAGDPHQRIYDNRVSLRDVGVNVTGRSRRLSINYRTTAEILGWSLALLRGEQIDEMMGSLDSIAGCRSDVHGSMPTVTGSGSVAAEVRQIVNTVRGWVAAGFEPEEIGIAVRSKWLGTRIEKQLVVAGIDAEFLGRARHAGGVAVATMHRMKGLEFRCMIVAGVSVGQVRYRQRLPPLPRMHTSMPWTCSGSGASCLWRAPGHGRSWWSRGTASRASSCLEGSAGVVDADGPESSECPVTGSAGAPDPHPFVQEVLNQIGGPPDYLNGESCAFECGGHFAGYLARCAACVEEQVDVFREP